LFLAALGLLTPEEEVAGAFWERDRVDLVAAPPTPLFKMALAWSKLRVGMNWRVELVLVEFVDFTSLSESYPFLELIVELFRARMFLATLESCYEG
jgi:hypothetical protein